jgi:hypothetical protein
MRAGCPRSQDKQRARACARALVAAIAIWSEAFRVQLPLSRLPITGRDQSSGGQPDDRDRRDKPSDDAYL